MDAFIKIGDLKGEAKDKTHKDEIDVLACCNGKHYDTATLTVRKAGTNPLEYLKVTMSEVLIAGVTTGGSGGEDRLTETVTLNLGKVKVDYREQTDKGAAGDTPSMTWDIAQNTNE